MMLAKKYSQPMTPQERIKGGASALPVIGDAISGYDAYQSAKQGDYLGAALNAIGLLPIIPAITKVSKNVSNPSSVTAKKILNENLISSAPKLNNTTSDEMVRLYHGSRSSNPIEVNNGGLFGGVFSSADKSSALSHGDNIHYLDIPKSKIADSHNLDVKNIYSELKNSIPGIKKSELDEIRDIVVYDKNLFNSSIPEDRIMDIFSASDLGEASWNAQRIRGEIAKKLGFSAVKMNDEHGISYLILPGNKLQR